jgi:hypothetical protein
MPKRLRLTIYREGSANYGYVLHGANPSVRGRFRTSVQLTGDSELAAIKDALHAFSPRLQSYIANLRIVP